jgi:hypothetical protein
MLTPRSGVDDVELEAGPEPAKSAAA